MPSNESQLGLGIFLGVFGGVVNIALVALLLLSADQQSEYSGSGVGFGVKMLLLGGAGLVCALLMGKTTRRGSMLVIAFALAGIVASFVSVFFIGPWPLVLFFGSVMQAIGGNLGLMSLDKPRDPE